MKLCEAFNAATISTVTFGRLPAELPRPLRVRVTAHTDDGSASSVTAIVRQASTRTDGGAEIGRGTWLCSAGGAADPASFVDAVVPVDRRGLGDQFLSVEIQTNHGSDLFCTVCIEGV